MNHSFDVDIAVKHGVHAAVLHQTIVFWVLKNKANGKHIHDGRHWTYNSAKAFAELFPYLSTDQIQRSLKRLEEAGLLVTGCFNSSPYDRTRWYSTAEGVVVDSADLRKVIPQDCGTYTSSYQVQTNSNTHAAHVAKDDAKPSPVAPADCPHQEIVKLFAEHLPMARQPAEWTTSRQALLRTRWKEKANRQNLEWWARFFAYVAQSDFLTGKAGTAGRKPFELDLPWLLKAENFLKVIEGKYHSEVDA